MNFPPCLRNKLHIGLHIASFDNGLDCTLDLFAKDLKSLYENPISYEGDVYYVVVSQILMDGPGRNSFCKLLGPRAFRV